MILFKDIVQKTEPWFKIKHAKIGGSTAKGLTVKGDTLMLSILAEMCEDYEPSDNGYESADMQRGNELEPVAVRDLEVYTGVKFQEIGWIEHETIKLIGISPDGLSESAEIACEIKCPSAKKHTETIRDNIIPLDNIHQCLQYFAVIDTLKTLHFASFRPEHKYKPLFVKTITRDSVVNIGTKAKPVEKTISQCIDIYEEAAVSMQVKLKNELELVKF
jgi:hypothetical protein